MLLWPVGWLYGKIADIRNTLYEKGVLKSYTLGARTISIGNITTGGTGKTPLVEFVATDDYEQTHELVAVIRGSDGGRHMYGIGDQLPRAYAERFRTQIVGAA